MRISDLTLINYRRFEHQSFVFNRHFTVLIGDNASGKTQILRSIVTLLSQYQCRMLRIKTYNPNENDTDGNECAHSEIMQADVHHESQVYENGKAHQLRMEQYYPVIISADFDNGNYVFCRKDDETNEANVRNSYFERLADEDLNKIKGQQDVTLPVLAHYGTSRLWNKRNRLKEGIPSRTDGYRWSLDGFVDFDELREWFKDQEMIHLQKGTNGIVLSVMRKALANMINGCEDVFYDMEAKSIVVKFGKEQSLPFSDRNLLFDDLSDGYRMILTIVFDLVKQMFLLNPHLGEETLAKTDGIVLIDELDLSLHPKWQRVVVDSLKKTFPLVQFIVTTHSPFIIQSLDSGEVIDLGGSKGEVLEKHWTYIKQKAVDKDASILSMIDEQHLIVNQEEGIACPGAMGEYEKRSLEDIAEDVMQIEIPQRSARLMEMYKAAKKYYELLENANGASEEEKLRLKDELDRLSAPFSQDVAYYAFLDFKREMALKNQN